MYSLCVKMDQFPGANVEIALVEESGRRHVISAPHKEELNTRFFEWIRAFSEYEY